MTRPNLHVVKPELEQSLFVLVPELAAAEQEVARIRRLIDIERRRLASKRGVAFIREETVRREFGG